MTTVEQQQRLLTIGTVCGLLKTEFPDISISKIRYLEDQKLLSPLRTPGGYRLYTPGDVARLRTILRMQRDEFLPLRVIRQELLVLEVADLRDGDVGELLRERLADRPDRHRLAARRALVDLREFDVGHGH